jgi:hypothetical protein
MTALFQRFDKDEIDCMGRALEAAVNTMRLGGVDPTADERLAMARRLVASDRDDRGSLLAMTAIALGWSQRH